MLKLTFYFFFIWWKSEPVEFLQKRKSFIRVLSEISYAPLVYHFKVSGWILVTIC